MGNTQQNNYSNTKDLTKPDPRNPQFENETEDWEVELVDVPPTSEKFQKITEHLSSSKFEFDVVSIKEIINVRLEEKVKRNIERNEEFKSYPLRMYHGCTSESALSIAKHNFNWRRFVRDRYGKGVYFARYSGYACFYPDDIVLSKERCMIISDVFICFNNTFCSEFWNGDYLPAPYNTLWIEGKNICVKFDDNETIPRYIVNYCLKEKEPFPTNPDYVADDKQQNKETDSKTDDKKDIISENNNSTKRKINDVKNIPETNNKKVKCDEKDEAILKNVEKNDRDKENF